MATERRSKLLMNRIVDRINTHTKRLRMLEQSTKVLSSRVNNIEQIINKQHRETRVALSKIDNNLKKQIERINMFENTLKEIKIQMKRFATKIDVKSLERLIDMYSPLESKFVTKEEVERIIEERINR